MTVIKLPDGDLVDFGDMSREQIQQQIIQMFPNEVKNKFGVDAGVQGEWAAKRERFNPSDRDQYPSGVENLVQGMTFNHADNALRALGMDEQANQMERRQYQFRENHPVGAMGYETLGSGITTGVVGGPVLSAASKVPGIGPLASMVQKGFSPAGKALGTRMAQGAAMGGGLSGLSSRGEGKSSQDILFDSMVGAGIGAAVPVAGEALKKSVDWGRDLLNRLSKAGKASAAAPAITHEELEGAAKQLYKNLDGMGVGLKPEAVVDLRNALDDALEIRGLRPEEMTDTQRAMIGRIRRALVEQVDPTKPVSLNKVRELAKEIGQMAWDKQAPLENRLLQKLDGVMDEFMFDKLGSNVLDRNVPGAKDAAKIANDLFAKSRRAWIMERYIGEVEQSADQMSQGGYGNALKTQMKQLLKQITPPKNAPWKRPRIGGFSAKDVEAIRAISEGRFEPRFVRWLSKWSPRGGLSGQLQAGAIGAGAVHAVQTGNPLPLAAATAGSGTAYAGGKASDAYARSAADELVKVIAGRQGNLPPLPRANTPMPPDAVRMGLTGGAAAGGGPQLGDYADPYMNPFKPPRYR